MSANAHYNLLSTALKLKQNQMRPRFRARSLTYASLVSGSERRPTTAVAVRVRVQPFAGCRRSSSGRPALLQPTVRHGAQESAVQRKRQKQRRNPDCTSRVADTWRLLRAHCFLEPRAGVIARSAGRMIDRTTRACVPPENAVPFRTGWSFCGAQRTLLRAPMAHQPYQYRPEQTAVPVGGGFVSPGFAAPPPLQFVASSFSEAQQAPVGGAGGSFAAAYPPPAAYGPAGGSFGLPQAAYGAGAGFAAGAASFDDEPPLLEGAHNAAEACHAAAAQS